MADPWLKFYPTDWRSDPALRMCSMAARGLWIEIIALMHEATPYGHLVVSGRSPTDAQLAVLVGAPSDHIPELIGELETAGVFSRTREGVIYSRKMTRIAKKAAIARKNGKNGGNPSLRKQSENQASDNQNDKGEDNTQKPEARSQKEEKREANASPKNGSRLSPEWFLPRDLGEWAMSEGMTRDEIRSEADKFRDYWIGVAGAKGRKADWPATWRNWVRKFIAERANGRGNGNRIPATSQGGKRVDPALEQIARLAGIGPTPGDGRGGTGGFGEEAGPLWLGARPQ